MVDDSQLQHGTHYRGQRLRGWIATEKFRGARLAWDGAFAWTRSGHRIALPDRYLAGLPVGFALDIEVWCGFGPAGGAPECAAADAVKHGRFPSGTRLKIFDAPAASGNQFERLNLARLALDLVPVRSPLVEVVDFTLIESERHAARLLGQVHRRGGEGLMLCDPRASYTRARTPTLVKLKRPYYAAFLGS